MSRYRWVDDRRAEGFPTQAACAAVSVSGSAYYDWSRAHEGGATSSEWDEAVLVNAIRTIHAAHDDHGSPRMTRVLQRLGFWVNHKRVERLMRYNGIYAIDGRRARVRTTIPDVCAPPLPDLVRRDFSPGEQDRRWAGDITYIGTDVIDRILDELVHRQGQAIPVSLRLGFLDGSK